jgi:hypothetical protein
MHAMVGDRLHVHSRVVETSAQMSELIEIRGPGSAPPRPVATGDGDRVATCQDLSHVCRMLDPVMVTTRAGRALRQRSKKAVTR